MQFYLSSIGLGRETHKLKEMLPENRLTAYIPNAIDYSSDISRRNKSNGQDMDDLRSVGLDPEILDLRDYFGKTDSLESALENFGVIWVRGGNVFVLRQAMRLSGFDAIIKKLKKEPFFMAATAQVYVCCHPPFMVLNLWTMFLKSLMAMILKQSGKGSV